MAETKDGHPSWIYHHYKGNVVHRIDNPIPVELPDTVSYTWTHLRTDNDQVIKSDETDQFLKSLSFDSYILAGGAVVDMIEGNAIRDLDLWVMKDPLSALNEILSKYSDKSPIFRIFPSMIEITSILYPTCPPINLIFSGKSAEETIDEFDFDYCRCYYTHQTGIMAYRECLTCLKTRYIHDPITYSDIRPQRFLKSIKKGFLFDRKFYNHHQSLGIGPSYCPIDNSDLWHGCKHTNYWLTPLPVSLKDIDTNSSYFMSWDQQLKMNCSSIEEIEEQLHKLNHTQKVYLPCQIEEIPSKYIRPPILAKTKSIDLVKEHVAKVMIKYPVQYGNYEAMYLC